MSNHEDFGNRTWLYNGDGSTYCSRHSNLRLCYSYVPQNYDYHINLAANIAFAAIFTLSLLLHTLTWITTRRASTFTCAAIMSVICEILGYIGRILSWTDPWAQLGFITQICCLTIGPVFMAAGIYLCLGKIVNFLGPEHSRISPQLYSRIVSKISKLNGVASHIQIKLMSQM